MAVPEIKLTAKGPWHGSDIQATVLNPEECQSSYGRLYLVWVADCYSPPIYAVHAGSLEEAVDIFVESPQGASLQIDPATEGDDYGFECHPGDMIGGKNITEHGWMTLSGKWITDATEAKYLIDPPCIDGGIYYDGDNLHVEDSVSHKTWRYFGHLLPPTGVLCSEYPKFYEELTARFARAEEFAKFLAERAKPKEADTSVTCQN